MLVPWSSLFSFPSVLLAGERAAPGAVFLDLDPTAAAMFSFWQRLNAIFFFALSVLGFLSFLGAGMTYWHVSSPRIELTLEKILLRKIYGAGHDQVVAPSTPCVIDLPPRTPLLAHTSRLTPRGRRSSRLASTPTYAPCGTGT